MAETDGSVLEAVGARLRALRRQRGATLQELADSTGISVSTLSRLECGQRRPTLEHLLPLARAHRVPLDELVGAPAVGDPRIHPRPITHHGTIWLPLSRNPGGLNVFKQIVPVEPKPARRLERRVHEGYDWLYVITGRLRLALGAEEYALGAGEAVEFDTRVPHSYANAGSKPLELLVIFGSEGERVHVRAGSGSKRRVAR